MTHRIQISHLRGRVGFSLLVLSTLLAMIPTLAQAQIGPFAVGDVFVGIGRGRVAHYDPTGKLLQELETGDRSQDVTGLCFDAAGNLYTTNWNRRTMAKFDNTGDLLKKSWGGSMNGRPIDCAVNATGAIYVGMVDGLGPSIWKYDATGSLLTTFDPASELRDVGALALGPDQCTLFYTSQGKLVKRYDVCTSTQLPDFAELPSDYAYQLKPRPNGDVLVVTYAAIYLLDATGAVLHTYTPSSVGEPYYFFSVSLDPDGTSFWTAGTLTGNIYKLDIATGAVLTVFTAPPVVDAVGGVAVFGAPEIAKPHMTDTEYRHILADAGHNHLAAHHLAADGALNTFKPCAATGGGTFRVGKDKTSFTFQLVCHPGQGVAALTVIWRNGKSRFDLDTLTSAFCSDDVNISGPDDFDTHQGTGTGSINGVPGATAMWSFGGTTKDYSTPARAEILIKDARGKVVLQVAGAPQATF